MNDPIEAPVFTRRRKDKYQVRFWSKQEHYEAFVAAAEKEGLVLQDALNELMLWFTKTHAEGKLLIREEPAPKDSEGK